MRQVGGLIVPGSVQASLGGEEHRAAAAPPEAVPVFGRNPTQAFSRRKVGLGGGYVWWWSTALNASLIFPN